MTDRIRRTTSPGAKAGLVGEVVRSARLVWRLMRDPRVGSATKLIIPGLMGAYLLWPVDLLPDWFLLVGQLDDLALLALSVKLFIDLSPPEVVREHRDGLAGHPPVAPSPESEGEVLDGEYRVIE